MLSMVRSCLFRGPRWLYVAALAALVPGVGWGLPHSESWANDAVSPRSSGLFAIALPYWWGHFHTYPPLHMLILTVLCLPVTGIASGVALVTHRGIEDVLLLPVTMTSIEGIARLVAMFMAVGIVDCTYRMWSRLENVRVGGLAALSVVGVVPWAYYGKVGNVDVPSVFWMCLALEQVLLLQPHPAQNPRAERRALVFATLAVLTKDQVAGALLIPLAWLVLAPAIAAWRSSSLTPVEERVGDRGRREWGRGLSNAARALTRASLFRSCALCIGLYAVLSGALVNPVGWVARLHFLFGPASRDWSGYERSLSGRITMMGDMLRQIPELTSWPSAVLSAVGIVACVLARRRRRNLLPVSGALSFTLAFNAMALRSEHRFLLVQSVLIAPYAALVTALPFHSKGVRSLGQLSFFVAWMASLLNVASLDATLIADSRYGAERFLATLPAHARIEIIGGAKFFPRFPGQLDLARVGLDAPETRSRIPGVREELGDLEAVDLRRPEYIVLSAEFATPEFLSSPARHGPTVEPNVLAFIRRLEEGREGYTLAYRSTCSVPWPLRCIRLHSCTGGDIAIFAAVRVPRSQPAAAP